MMKVKMIEKRQNGVCLFELQNDEIKVITSNLGCHILSVFTKDRLEILFVKDGQPQWKSSK